MQAVRRTALDVVSDRRAVVSARSTLDPHDLPVDGHVGHRCVANEISAVPMTARAVAHTRMSVIGPLK
jgi:hypothetical protein